MKINRFIKIYRLKVSKKYGRVVLLVMFLNVSRMLPIQRYCYLRYLINIDENCGGQRTSKINDVLKRLKVRSNQNCILA